MKAPVRTLIASLLFVCASFAEAGQLNEVCARQLEVTPLIPIQKGFRQSAYVAGLVEDGAAQIYVRAKFENNVLRLSLVRMDFSYTKTSGRHPALLASLSDVRPQNKRRFLRALRSDDQFVEAIASRAGVTPRLLRFGYVSQSNELFGETLDMIEAPQVDSETVEESYPSGYVNQSIADALWKLIRHTQYKTNPDRNYRVTLTRKRNAVPFLMGSLTATLERFQGGGGGVELPGLKVNREFIAAVDMELGAKPTEVRRLLARERFREGASDKLHVVIKSED